MDLDMLGNILKPTAESVIFFIEDWPEYNLGTR